MVHLLIIKVNPKEIDGVPVTGRPVGSRTVLGVITQCRKGELNSKREPKQIESAVGSHLYHCKATLPIPFDGKC